MLELHKRAEWIKNAEGVTWQHFVRSRFVGRRADREASMAVVVQTATQQSESHAELRGILEYSTDQSLPVVFEFVASVDLHTRELSVQGSDESRFSGQFSENGRVLRLRSHLAGSKTSIPFHLIHEDTLEQLIDLKSAH